MDSVQYIDMDGVKKITGTAERVVSGSTTWNTGWYVVDGNVTISDRITVTGDLNLILKDGCILTASSGINVAVGNSITIYAQSDATVDGSEAGKLVATGVAYGAGIGGNGIVITSAELENHAASAGTITINGGHIVATGDSGAAGIGGGSGGSGSIGYPSTPTPGGTGGTITINGGKVEAKVSVYRNDVVGAAIGGGGYGTRVAGGGSITCSSRARL